MEFVDRKEELEFFRGRLGSGESEFLVLYGRRRVGKTELLKQVLKEFDGVYHLVSRETEKDQIQELKQSIAQEHPGAEDLKNEWMPVLRFAAENLETLVIDEFPYLIETNEEILKQMQKAWDEHMKQGEFNLVITGSSIGVMESEVLGYKSPVYGRRTGQWKLKPFNYNQIQDFLPGYSNQELIRLYSVLGGTPYYLKQFQPGKKLEENIHDNMLKQGSILREEAERLLQQELRQPKNYFSILKAVSKGKTRFNEIRNETGIPNNSLSKYLKTLRNLHIIEKHLPVTASEKSKRGIYRIKDNYFNFWFRFIFPNQTMLEQKPENVLKNRIKPGFDQYASKPFEEICRQYIRQKAEYDKVGAWWYQEHEIDIAAINNQTKTLLLGEAKWTNQEIGEKELKQLKQKAGKVQWKNQERTKKYILFSKNSFKPQLKNKNVELINPEKLFQRNKNS